MSFLQLRSSIKSSVTPQRIDAGEFGGWRPIYPDQCLPKVALSAAILAGALFFVNAAVLPAAAQATASGTHSQIFPGKQIQYQSTVSPFQAAYAPTPTPTIDRWGQATNQPPRTVQIHSAFLSGSVQPPYIPILSPGGSSSALVVYPVDLRQYQSQVAPFQAALTPATVTISWLPSFPDQPVRAVSFAAFTSFYAQFNSVVPLGHLGWLPRYPDQIFTPSRLASLTAGLTEPQPRIDVNWLPSFPDKIDRGIVRAADQPFWTGPLFIPVNDLRWKAIYPDEIPRSVLSAATQPWLSFDAFPRPTVSATIEWLPDYPSQLTRLALAWGGLTEPPSSARSLGHVGWLPTYPDKIWPPARLLEGAQQAFGYSFGPTNPLGYLGWLGSYPDFARRLDLPTADQLAFVQPRYLPISDLRWESSYPDFINRLVVRAADQGFLFEPRYLPIADLRWEAVYPDKLWPAAALHASGQPLVAMVFGPVNPITDLRWAAQYPDFARELIPSPWLGSLAFYPLPFANAPSPLLAWHPIYPNWIWRAILPVAEYPYSTVQNLVPIPNPPVDGDEKHHLATIDSITVTSKPTIGGATGWGTS